MDIQAITSELIALSEVDAASREEREARDIKRAELLSIALKDEAYKAVAKSVSAYAKHVGITRAYVYQLAQTWDSERVRPHLETLGPARAIAIAQAEMQGLDTDIVEHLVARAPDMKVGDLKAQIKAEFQIPDEAKSTIQLTEELEDVMAKLRRLEEKRIELNGRADELRGLILAQT